MNINCYLAFEIMPIQFRIQKQIRNKNKNTNEDNFQGAGKFKFF